MNVTRCVGLGLLLAAALVVLAPAPVLADEAKPHAAKAHGEQPVDILEPRFDLGIWSIIVFVVLLFVLGKYAWGPMLDGLKNRERSIQDAITEAERTREEAPRLRDQFQGEVNNAHAKVREILDEARRDAERTTADMIEKARVEIQTESDRKRRELALAHDQTLQQLTTHAAQLATLITAKLLGRQVGADDHRRLVDEALGELRQAGTDRQRQGAGPRA